MVYILIYANKLIQLDQSPIQVEVFIYMYNATIKHMNLILIHLLRLYTKYHLQTLFTAIALGV